MGWGMLSEPGTEYGPCKERCEHTDCAATRKDAESKCLFCGERIGYGTKFYYVGDEGLEHAVCTWKKEDERQKSLRGSQ